MSADDPKRRAAERALTYIAPGMTIGIGTGSTADHFIDLLGERVAGGLHVVGVPSSERTRQRAEALGIRLTTLDAHPSLDLTVDGADEIDPEMQLIKGGGGALLREKIVACASRGLLVIADDSKLVGNLGRFPLPVEVVPFGLAVTRANVEQAAAACGCIGEIELRGGAAEPFVTDGGHLILDCRFGLIPDPPKLANRLDGIVGVVEHGLFIGLAVACIIGGADGVRMLGDPRRL